MKCIINVPKLALYLVTAFAALHAALKGLSPELELIARAVLTVTWGSKHPSYLICLKAVLLI